MEDYVHIPSTMEAERLKHLRLLRKEITAMHEFERQAIPILMEIEGKDPRARVALSVFYNLVVPLRADVRQRVKDAEGTA